MMNHLTFLLLAFMGMMGRVLADADLGYCCLCPKCTYPGARADIFLNDSGLSCAKLDSQMFNPGNDSKQGNGSCLQKQNSYRDACCNANSNFQSVVQKKTEPPTLNLPQGNEPWCDICFNKQFPTKPYTITTVAYVPGNPTCSDLYWMGRTGNIPGAVCYPLQLYMQGPCGCNAAPAPKPAPAPQPGPSPSPPNNGPPGLPSRKQAPKTKKNDLKLAGGRERGTTNKRLLLKGTEEQESMDEPLETVLLEIAAEIAQDMTSV